MPEEKKSSTANKPQTKSNDTSNDTLMGVLAYIGILCFIPLLAAKDSEFAQFHAKQGLNLFLLEVGVAVLSWVLGFMSIVGGLAFLGLMTMAIWIVQIGFFVLSIIGIVNALNGKKEPLPVIGGIKLVK